VVLVAAIAAGLGFAWLAINPFAFLNWGNIILWAAVCVGFGLMEGTQRAKAIRLGSLGFTLGFAFMCFGYGGAASLVSRFGPFALIGLFCAVCAIAVGATVHVIKQRMSH
jgi:hypothetical protein